MYLPHEKSFIQTIIPEVVSKLKSVIESKLQKCLFVTLIVDIWSSNQLVDFIGVCASLIDTDFSRKQIVIGLKRMPGKHDATNIKLMIENIVNEYTFNKTKIKSVVCSVSNRYAYIDKNIDIF